MSVGSREEWSLIRRHPSEGVFGVQLCGNKPASLVSAAEAIARECGPNVDFVDVNCGCPIDLVFTTGAGSARMSSTADCPLSVKLSHSSGLSDQARKDRCGYEQGAGRYPRHYQDADRRQRRQEHGAQAHATSAARIRRRRRFRASIQRRVPHPLTFEHRSMAGPASNGTRNWRTGTTSKSVRIHCGRRPKTRTVGTPPLRPKLCS